MNYELTDESRLWAEEVYEKIRVKIKAECARVGSAIPYIAEDGVYREDKAQTDICWWTNGFWGGIMWQMFSLTGEKLYEETAKKLEEKLDVVLNVLHLK